MRSTCYRSAAMVLAACLTMVSACGDESVLPMKPAPAAGSPSFRFDWLNPYPSGNSLIDLTSLDSGEIVAGGTGGAVLFHTPEESWRVDQVSAHTITKLTALPGGHLVAADDRDFLYLYDGADWRELGAPPGITNQWSLINDIHGTSDTNIWVCGDRGIARFDGSGWIEIDDSQASRVWSFSPDVTYAIRQSRVYRITQDSVTWALDDTLFQAKALFGTGDETLIVAGSDGFAQTRASYYTYDGDDWALGDSLDRRFPLAVDGTGEHDFWIAFSNGYHHWNGQRWSHPPDNPYRVKESSMVIHNDGALWVLGSQFGMFHLDSDGWLPGFGGFGASLSLPFEWRGELYCFTSQRDTLFHLIGNQAEFLNLDDEFAAWSFANDVLSLTTDEIFLAGHLGIASSLGSGWDVYKPPSDLSLYAIDGSSRESVWAVGRTGLVLHFNGREWINRSGSTRVTLNSVLVSDDNVVWIGGAGGHISQLENDQWILNETPTNSAIFDLHETRSGTIYALGLDGTVLLYSGKTWHRQFFPNSDQLRQMAETSDGRLFIRGSDGIYVLGESGWQSIFLPDRASSFNDIYPLDDGQFLLVGDAGRVLLATPE